MSDDRYAQCGQCGQPVDKQDATSGAVLGATAVCASCLRFELDLDDDAVDDPPVSSEPGRRGGSPRFYELLEEMGGVHAAKNADYSRGGSDPFRNFRQCERFGIPAWQGALIRLQDKYERCCNLVANFQEKGVLEGAVKDETFADTIIDLANYSLIVRCLYEEWMQARNQASTDKMVDDYKRNASVYHDIATRVWADHTAGPKAADVMAAATDFLGPSVEIDNAAGAGRNVPHTHVHAYKPQELTPAEIAYGTTVGGGKTVLGNTRDIELPDGSKIKFLVDPGLDGSMFITLQHHPAPGSTQTERKEGPG